MSDENDTPDKWKPHFVWIGKRLRWARELVYPTQAEFAYVMDMPQATLDKIEKGERMLSVVSLISASNKLRTGSEFLLFGDLTQVDPELRRLLVKKHPELAEPMLQPNGSTKH